MRFLTHLAVERKVAKSTQNVSFNAILFFFRRVLDKDIGALWQAVRAERKQRLPVVLTPEEVQQVFDQMRDIRTVQDLLGHANLQTTMIYTHVARHNKLGVRSPLERWPSGG